MGSMFVGLIVSHPLLLSCALQYLVIKGILNIKLIPNQHLDHYNEFCLKHSDCLQSNSYSDQIIQDMYTVILRT